MAKKKAKKGKTGKCIGNGGARAGSGMKPNQASKWPTPKERKAACKSFCDHLRSGYSVISWPGADESTIKRYLKNFPGDFSPKDVAMAKRESLKFWEDIGIAGTTGKLKGFNARSWEVNMNNRAGWVTKVDITSGGEKLEAINVALLTPEEAARAYHDKIKGE